MKNFYRNHCDSSTSRLQRLALELLLLVFAALPVRAETTRHIPLEGQSNFRDIGGYVKESGQSVRWSEIYRSGELPRLNDVDVAKVDALGISTVVNFLTPAEIADRGKDRLPDDVETIEAPIAGGEQELTVVITEARRTGDFSEVPTELNADIHSLLITDEEAREQYAVFLRAAMDPENRPLVMHCSHGVHRTGTATALLLSALGVPWETVREDYLLSNTYRAAEIDGRLAELRDLAATAQGVPPDDVDMTNAEAFFQLEASYIDASYEAMLDTYGSVDGYLLNGVGLTEQELSRLRSELLE